MPSQHGKSFGSTRRDDDADDCDSRRLVRVAVFRADVVRADGSRGLRVSCARRHSGHRHSAEDRDGGELVSAACGAAVHPDGQRDEHGGHQLSHFRFRQSDGRMDARRVMPGEHHWLGHLRRHERFGGRRRRGTGHCRNRGDEKGGLRRRNGRRDHRGIGDDWSDHSAVAADDCLWRCRGNVRRRAVHCGRDSGFVDGCRIDAHGAKPLHPAEHAAPSVRRLARAVAIVPPRVLGDRGAVSVDRRHVLRCLHADGSRGGRRRLRVGARLVRLSRIHLARLAEAHY